MSKTKTETKVKTKVMQCACKHIFQDDRYGVGKRVFNATTKTPGNIFRCTVCGNVRAA